MELMFSLKQCKHMYSAAARLGLGLWDSGRLFWSYYASRIPGAQSRAAKCVQINVGNGMAARLFIRENGYDWALVEEIFADHVYRVEAENVKRVVDLGGNIGLSSLFFAKQYPGAEICCVEPIPDNIALLRRNVEINHLQIRIVTAAVGAKDGKARFELSVDPRQHAVSDSKVITPGVRSVDVEVLSVPSLMRLMGWEEIDLLTIDIEGGEVEVLGGRPQWLEKVHCIIGEGHIGAGYTIEACRRDQIGRASCRGR